LYIKAWYNSQEGLLYIKVPKIKEDSMKAPIIDAVFDIWFESKMPSEALLGIIVENIESYQNIRSLPLLQLPKDIRLMDPNLKHQAPLWPYFC